MLTAPRTSEHNNRTIPLREDQLTARHKLLVEYMLHGVAHPSLCERTRIPDGYDPETGQPMLRHPRVGEPLDLMAAAEVLHIKRRHARSLSMQPVFQRLLAAETQAFRDGSRARATRRMVALIDDPGAGKAADRKVQLAAAQAVLGEGDGNRPGVNVNIGLSGQTLTAGIVIIDPRAQPTTQPHAHQTIEHEECGA